jgi:hypothetical protein
MRYSDVCDAIQTGDVLLFRGRRWYSWLIRFWTQSVYSHVGVAYRLKVNGHSRLCLFEAVAFQGVRLHPMDRYMSECVRAGSQVDWYALVDGVGVNREKVADQCLQRWADSYAGLVQFWWSFGLGRFVRQAFKLPSRLGRGEFCSWIAAEALQHGGYRAGYGDPADPALTDPGALSRYTCLQHRGTLTL